MLAGEENPEKIFATNFDVIRLESLSANDALDSETGTWRALRYAKEWVILEQVGKFRMLEFKSLDDLKRFLKT